MITKKTLTVTLLASVMSITAPAMATEQFFQFETITDIDVSAGLELVVTQGEKQEVRAVPANGSTLENLEISVDGQTLKVAIDSDFLDFIMDGGLLGTIFGHPPRIKLYVTVPKLEKISASAGAYVEMNMFSGDHFTAVSSSGAQIELSDMTFGNVKLHASSGSQLEIDGTCAEISASASSGAQIEAEELICKNGKATASSGAGVDIYTSNHIDAKASSGGSIQIVGDPETNDIKTSSGGSVRG